MFGIALSFGLRSLNTLQRCSVVVVVTASGRRIAGTGPNATAGSRHYELFDFLTQLLA